MSRFASFFGQAHCQVRLGLPELTNAMSIVHTYASFRPRGVSQTKPIANCVAKHRVVLYPQLVLLIEVVQLRASFQLLVGTVTHPSPGIVEPTLLTPTQLSGSRTPQDSHFP